MRRPRGGSTTRTGTQSRKRPLLCTDGRCHITSHVLLLLLVGYAVASLAAAPRALLFLAAFGVVCVALPAPAPAALYAVAMAWLLLKNSKFLSY